MSRDTERLVVRDRVRRFPGEFLRLMFRKLVVLDAAEQLEDVGSPPDNRFGKLNGGRAEQHTIRIGDQWRSCFRWDNGNALDVAIVEYH